MILMMTCMSDIKVTLPVLKNSQDNIIYAVDFDGTLCRNAWPDIGEPNHALISDLILARELGDKVILWTMREDDLLDTAVKWCNEHGLQFDAINDNLPEQQIVYGNNPRKIYADAYLDDHNAWIEW